MPTRRIRIRMKSEVTEAGEPVEAGLDYTLKTVFQKRKRTKISDRFMKLLVRLKAAFLVNLSS